MSVRISATDWVEGGFTPDDAVAFARMLAEHGCDIIDVSSGQVDPEERPAFGRSFQTPFADRIRNEVGMPTIAVGAIASYDDVNTIVLAGRADLCALARPHLYDPHWTLHAAAEQEYAGDGIEWVPAVPGRQPQAADRPRRRGAQGAAAHLRARPARAAHRPGGLVLATLGPGGAPPGCAGRRRAVAFAWRCCGRWVRARRCLVRRALRCAADSGAGGEVGRARRLCQPAAAGATGGPAGSAAGVAWVAGAAWVAWVAWVAGRSTRASPTSPAPTAAAEQNT